MSDYGSQKNFSLQSTSALQTPQLLWTPRYYGHELKFQSRQIRITENNSSCYEFHLLQTPNCGLKSVSYIVGVDCSGSEEYINMHTCIVAKTEFY